MFLRLLPPIPLANQLILWVCLLLVVVVSASSEPPPNVRVPPTAQETPGLLHCSIKRRKLKGQVFKEERGPFSSFQIRI